MIYIQRTHLIADIFKTTQNNSMLTDTKMFYEKKESEMSRKSEPRNETTTVEPHCGH